MSCKHSTRPNAGWCSQCAGIPARRVTQEGNMLCIDGEPVRLIDGETGLPFRIGRRR